MRDTTTMPFSRLAATIMFLLPSAAVAGNVTFVDLLDTITLSDDTGRTSGFSCQGETCSVTLLPPAGTGGVGLSIISTAWVEPGTNNLSDQFCQAADCIFSPQSAFISFTSDTEGVSLGPCQLTFCPAENGSVQTAITVNWFNQAGAPIGSDNINLQSDNEVPEPSSGLLLLAGISVLGLTIRRRRNLATHL